MEIDTQPLCEAIVRDLRGLHAWTICPTDILRAAAILRRPVPASVVGEFLDIGAFREIPEGFHP